MNHNAISTTNGLVITFNENIALSCSNMARGDFNPMAGVGFLSFKSAIATRTLMLHDMPMIRRHHRVFPKSESILFVAKP